MKENEGKLYIYIHRMFEMNVIPQNPDVLFIKKMSI